MSASVLDPQILAATRGLRLAVKQLVYGLLPGVHPSRQPGMAREFSQYRAYQPGDDPRHIDWKLYARSDRYFLRESEIETAVTVRLILDATASMRHMDSTGAGAGKRKFDSARILTAALAWLAQAQGDLVGLHVITDGKVLSVPPGHHRQPLERVLHLLARLEPSGSWPTDGRALQTAVAARAGVGSEKKELAVLITDLHEQGEEIHAALAPLRASGCELMLLHLIGRDESVFPFRGTVRFEDWETGAVIECDAESARQAWLEGQERVMRDWRRAWAADRFHYAPIALDEPLDRALRACLLWRMKR